VLDNWAELAAHVGVLGLHPCLVCCGRGRAVSRPALAGSAAAAAAETVP